MAVENNLHRSIFTMLGVSKLNYRGVECARVGETMKIVYLK